MSTPIEFIKYIIQVANNEPTNAKAYWSLFMTSKAGNEVLADMLQRYWINRTAGDNLTAEQTAYYEGQRSVVTNLITTLQLSQLPEENNDE